jgi:hypothetical protein
MGFWELVFFVAAVIVVAVVELIIFLIALGCVFFAAGWVWAWIRSHFGN